MAIRLPSSIKVGDILDSIRLPGSIALASPPTKPYTLGVSDLAAKSSFRC